MYFREMFDNFRKQTVSPSNPSVENVEADIHPNHDFYLPLISNHLDCYQIYDFTNQGIPLSPVFPDLNAIKEWLIKVRSYSPEFAESFCRFGYPVSKTPSDQAGFFRTGQEGLLNGYYVVSFNINLQAGFAWMDTDPSSDWINGSRVAAVVVFEPQSSDQDQKVAYKNLCGDEEHEKPYFFDDLVVLLDNFPQKPVELTFPKKSGLAGK